MRLNTGFVRLIDVGYNNVLVWREAERALVELGQLAQTCTERHARFINDTAIFEPQRAMPLAVHVLQPAVVVRVGFEAEGPGLFERITKAVLKLSAEVVGAAPVLVNRVLQTCLLPVLAVSCVALNQQDFATHVVYFVDRYKADNTGQSRVRCLHRMRDTHTTSNTNVEAKQFRVVLVCNSNQSNIVCEYIHIVTWRQSHRNFELARQVVWTVQWLIILKRTTHKQLARAVRALVKPNFMIRIHAWQQ